MKWINLCFSHFDSVLCLKRFLLCGLPPVCCNPLQVLQEALTVISLLDVLCEMTSDHKQFMFLQDHPDLLVTTVGKWKTAIKSTTEQQQTLNSPQSPNAGKFEVYHLICFLKEKSRISFVKISYNLNSFMLLLRRCSAFPVVCHKLSMQSSWSRYTPLGRPVRIFSVLLRTSPSVEMETLLLILLSSALRHISSGSLETSATAIPTTRTRFGQMNECRDGSLWWYLITTVTKSEWKFCCKP